MIKLDSSNYSAISRLVTSQDELSVFSVINGIMPGEIFVNNKENPTAVLIQTSECNLIAGNCDDAAFNSQISSELDFWDQLTPDSSKWNEKIPTIHRNPFIKKYRRNHYVLSKDRFLECNTDLPEGFSLQKVNLDFLRKECFENSDKVLKWAGNWGNDETFYQYGTGYFICHDKIIVSWSLSDCGLDSRTAIGVHTDERYRNMGLGKKVVSATIKDCFDKGYQTIDWLCVDSNKGSRAIAEKLGFVHQNDYVSFSSYPPIENFTDLSEPEWHEWAEYLENASKSEAELIWECLFSYIKSNDVDKTIAIMKKMQQQNLPIDYTRFIGFVAMLQSYGMCSSFRKKLWIDFINSQQ